MAIDNDDGSAFFKTHDNVFYYASVSAAYGGNSLKSDFGGAANHHYNNLDIAFGEGFGICSQPAGYADEYSGNFLYATNGGNYGSGQTCTGAGATIVGNNTIWSPTGVTTECGMSLAAWQAKGNDAGTVAAAWPADSVVIALARSILGM